jgi:hypothetical protein
VFLPSVTVADNERQAGRRCFQMIVRSVSDKRERRER